jgi:cytochrome c peroxidase
MYAWVANMTKFDQDTARKQANDLRAAHEATLLRDAPPVLFAPAKSTKKKKEAAQNLALPAAYEKDWNKLKAAFSAQFPGQMIAEDTLSFPNLETALAFFTKQAQQGLHFLMSRYVNGAATDEHAFSCGDGQLYYGSAVEIEAQLKATISQSSNATTEAGLKLFLTTVAKMHCPTSHMREKLQGHKEVSSATEAHSASDEHARVQPTSKV